MHTLIFLFPCNHTNGQLFILNFSNLSSKLTQYNALFVSDDVVSSDFFSLVILLNDVLCAVLLQYKDTCSN